MNKIDKIDKIDKLITHLHISLSYEPDASEVPSGLNLAECISPYNIRTYTNTS